jgi:hypothetical protein
MPGLTGRRIGSQILEQVLGISNSEEWDYAPRKPLGSEPKYFCKKLKPFD